MINTKKIILFSLLLLISLDNFAQLKLPKLISNHLILQRDKPIKIWGKAIPNADVNLLFDKDSFMTRADESGNWEFLLPAQQAGGPHTFKFIADKQIQVEDIWFGDVWLCSGQSNMELMMERVKDTYPTEIKTADNQLIRQFTVPDEYDFEQERNDFTGGEWMPLSSANIKSFSAVAYFFSKKVYDKTNVPIGIINAALGGAPIESWVSEQDLIQFPHLLQEGQKFKNKELIKQIEAKNKEINQNWYANVNLNDIGLKENWKQKTANNLTWKSIEIPSFWTDIDSSIKTGSVWFKKTFDLNPEQTQESPRLFLGRIVDADSVFVNGHFIGTTSYQYPPRKYMIPQGILKEKNNEITIRVLNSLGKGGFIRDKPYAIYFSKDTLDLQGKWQFSVGNQIAPIEAQTTIRWKPFGLYNAMIAPLRNLNLKGVLWYQGESNTDSTFSYGEMLKSLVFRWRNDFNDQKLPFIGIQLANFLEPTSAPSESNWAKLRQEQLSLLSIPNTGLVVTIDLGEWNDIHPLNKADVGKRAALQALKIAYKDEKLISSGPIIHKAYQKNNKIHLVFNEIGTGLKSLSSEGINHLAIAEVDKKFVWTKGTIVENEVIIDIPKNIKAKYIRYAWANNPDKANLYNKEMLPASPFEIEIK